MPLVLRTLLPLALGHGVACLGLLAAVPASAQSVLVSSDFTLTHEDWTLAPSAAPAPHFPALPGPAGPSRGYIYIPAATPQAGFNAPAKFLGDQSAAIGGQLSFRMLVDTGLTYPDGLLVIRGAGIALAGRDLSGEGSTTWVTRVIGLSEGNLRNLDGGQPATAQQIESVFRDISSISFVTSGSSSYAAFTALDDVQLLSAVPEPATWALWGAGLCGLVAMSRLRQAGGRDRAAL